jgi:hypothetical protein
MGIVDMAALAQRIVDNFGGQIALGICVPHGVIAKQLVDIVTRAMRERPKNRQASAAQLVWRAVTDTWPCQGQ